MANNAGVWIDHRKAVIVTVAADGESVQEIESKAAGHVRYTGGPLAEPEDRRDRHIMKELNDYYDEVIDTIRAAEWIYVFGPGEGKTEFAKRLEHRGLAGHLGSVEPAGEMTNPQIVAQVRAHFANAWHPKPSKPHNTGH